MSLRSKQGKIAAAGASLALAATVMSVGLISATEAAWAAPASPGIERLLQAPPAPSSPKPSPKPGQQGPGERGQTMEQRHQAYHAALAARLGLSTEQLTAAMKQARIDVVNQEVAAGRLTQEQANRMIQAIQTGQRPGGPGGPGMRGAGQGQPGQQGPNRHGPGGPGAGMRGGMDVAGIIGISQEQLRTEFQAGKTLAQIAQEKGISRDQLKQKLLDARKAQLDAAVAAGQMTADQASQMMTRMSANIDRMLDMKPGQRGPGQRPSGTN